MTRPTDAVRSAIRRCLAQLADLPRDPLALVACSGGPDSLALAAGTAEAVGRAGWRAGAVVVDHGLQPGSATVAEAAAARCASLGLQPVLVRRVSVGSSGGPEAAARTARYAAFAGAAESTGAAAVLLGHSLDDQAETVLLGLARGSGPRSLAGMASRADLPGRPRTSLLRPLLGLTREQLAAACEQWGLQPWLDPHNGDHAYTRVRVREVAMPALTEALGPGVPQALARTAALLRDDDAVLSELAAQALAGLLPEDSPVGADSRSLACSDLVSQPPAIRRRMLQRLVVGTGSPSGAVTASHLMVLDALVVSGVPGGPVALPGGIGAWVRCGRLFLARTGE